MLAILLLALTANAEDKTAEAARARQLDAVDVAARQDLLSAGAWTCGGVSYNKKLNQICTYDNDDSMICTYVTDWRGGAGETIRTSAVLSSNINNIGKSELLRVQKARLTSLVVLMDYCTPKE